MNSHVSVLLEESLAALAIRPSGIYVDGTLGRGGHSLRIASQLTDGHLYAFDLDQQAIEESALRLQPVMDRVTLIHANFADAQQQLRQRGVEAIDGMLLDLGVSSPQFDDGQRGFSYRSDARLDMRMNQEQELSAWTLVNEADEVRLREILWNYGEEPYARVLAAAIVRRRQKQPIDTTFQLVEVIREALPARQLSKKGHPAKQTFQALRIAVNGELDALQQGLKQAMNLLKPQGRLAVITFHSLEDRIVKNCFRDASSVAKVDRRLPLRPDQLTQPQFRLITRKPILPGERELEENNRSHSAKLRVLERMGDEHHGQDSKKEKKTEN